MKRHVCQHVFTGISDSICMCVCMHINKKNYLECKYFPTENTRSLKHQATNKLEPLNCQTPHLRNLPKPINLECTSYDSSMSNSQLSTTFKTFKLKMLLFQFTILDTQKGWVARLIANFPTSCQSVFLLCRKVFIKTSALQKILSTSF